MLHETGVEIEAESRGAFEHTREGLCDWQSIGRCVRSPGAARRWMPTRRAGSARRKAQEIWRPLGMVSALDYMERVLGYGPRAGQERLRVARALGALPQLTAALAGGELPFCAVRELTRVATPATEAAWRKAAAGKNLRQIEELVTDHRPGDRPEDPSSVAKANAHVGAPTKLDVTAPRAQSKDAVRRSPEPSSIARLDAHVGAPTKLDMAILPHVGAPTKLDMAVLRTQAKEALIALGWKPAIATAAVAAASAALGAEPTLERMIFEALRRCPQPAC